MITYPTIEDDLKAQTNPCPSCQGECEVLVYRKVTGTWRGWVCECAGCNLIVVEWDEPERPSLHEETFNELTI